MQKAMRQAFTLIVIGILLVPVWMFIGAAFPAQDRLVESHPSTTWPEQIAWIAMWASFIAAAARVAYAFIFEKGADAPLLSTKELSGEIPHAGLPAGDSFKSAYAHRWQTTGELTPVDADPNTSRRP
jgi:hypothetical protein